MFATLVVSACAPLLAPPAAPTLDPGTLNTIIAQTAGAAATQTALVSPPTSTLIPTPTLLIATTATEIPSLTPTFIFVLRTPTKPRPTATASRRDAKYACEVLSQMPEDNVVLSPGTVFVVRWQVKNTGVREWDGDNMDYRFLSGAALHKKSAYDLYKTVPVGGTADIIVDMQAPDNPDTYSTTWYLRVGKNGFCNMRLIIVVE
ncbi:MAG: hypothetical protein A2Z03_07860 [Chloroflexi bacterium RBG_16_56_8]|nr:MAG: hypothetical protein A2Z03_07860 [Chloroflexi bacterium RBG_16_56_8]